MENRNRMLAPWHPNDCMSKLWRHLKSCANYGFYAGETVPDNILQDAALIVINRSCAYNQCYLDFKCEAYQSFANVKIFFDAAEANRSEVMEEAGAHCYGMNAFGDFLYNIYIICSICSIYTIYILFIIFILYILYIYTIYTINTIYILYTLYIIYIIYIIYTLPITYTDSLETPTLSMCDLILRPQKQKRRILVSMNKRVTIIYIIILKT